jgi:hypothetical protein
MSDETRQILAFDYVVPLFHYVEDECILAPFVLGGFLRLRKPLLRMDEPLIVLQAVLLAVLGWLQ